MPHIILEHNLTDKKLVSEICKDLHRELCTQETVSPDAVKSRSVFVDDVNIGSTLESLPFLHVEVKLFAGRDPNLKLKISQALLKVIKEKSPANSILSAELTELNSYSKFPE